MWCSTMTRDVSAASSRISSPSSLELALGQAAGGLVEQQELRLGGERPRQRDPLAHAVGQLAGPGVRHAGRPHPVKCLACLLPQPALVPAGAGQPEQRRPESGRGPAVRADHDVLDGGQPLEQAHALQCPGDAQPGQPVRAQVAVVAAVDEHLALIGPDEAAQDVQQRRLACPVRPDDADDLAGARPRAIRR